MALQPRRIFLDVQNRAFITSPTSTLPSSNPAFIDEDVEAVEIYALAPALNSLNSLSYVDLSSSTVKFAVGTTTPAALQTAWTAIPTTITDTVTEIQAGGSFGGTVDEIQRVTWSGATPIEGSYAIKFPQRSISYTAATSKILVAANHGLYDGDTVTDAGGTSYTVINSGQNSFSIAAIGSTAAITASSGTLTSAEKVTPPISYNATIAQVQQAVVDAGFSENGIPQIVVSGQNAKEITLYYAGRNGQGIYPNVVIVNSSLKGAPGVAANVSYNTSEIAALIAAGTTSVVMEIEIAEGAARQTFRQSATLSPDLITTTSPSPLPLSVSTSFDLQSANGSIFTVSVTNSGELMIAQIP